MLGRIDLDGRDGVPDLQGQTRPNGRDDGEAVDVALGCAGSEVGGEESAAKGYEKTGYDEDGHIVVDLGEETASRQVEGDGHNDIR